MFPGTAQPRPVYREFCPPVRRTQTGPPPTSLYAALALGAPFHFARPLGGRHTSLYSFSANRLLLDRSYDNKGYYCTSKSARYDISMISPQKNWKRQNQHIDQCLLSDTTLLKAPFCILRKGAASPTHYTRNIASFLLIQTRYIFS